MGLSESVSVVISSSTRAVTQKGFGTQLILSDEANFNARTQIFTDADATLAAALVGGTAALAYKAAQAAFSQNPAPESIKIGNVGASTVITFDAGTYTAGTISMTVNGVQKSAAYHTDKATTLADLVTAIKTHADVDASTALVGLVLTIVPATGKFISVLMQTGAPTLLDLGAITGTMTASITSKSTPQDLDDALTAIKLVDDDFYMVSEVAHDPAQQLLVAAWVEADGAKIYGLSSAVANIADVAPASDTTTIAALLKAASYTRSCGIYSAVAASQFPEAAAFGVIAPLSAGRYTLCYKQLAGISADTLTPTQSSNVRNKYFNTYETIGGQNVVRWGKKSDGGYLDFIVFRDWLVARLQESIFAQLVNVKKISYDDTGFAIIQQAMTSVFKEGQQPDAEGIRAITAYSKDSTGAQNGGYYIEFPKLEDISTANKQNRVLPNVLFKCWYTNGIHVVQINGTILL